MIVVWKQVDMEEEEENHVCASFSCYSLACFAGRSSHSYILIIAPVVPLYCMTITQTWMGAFLGPL